MQCDTTEKARTKAETMFNAGAAISEFGTRRRRSWKIQDMVVGILKKTSESMPGKGKLTGTSNVCFPNSYIIMFSAELDEGSPCHEI
jgi:nicotinate phosphoribosyltransferase